MKYRSVLNNNIDNKSVLIATNSITCSLFLELGSRTGLGEGLLDLTVYELADCPVCISPDENLVNEIFESNSKREIGSLIFEITQKPRKMLDDLVFDIIGLSSNEREGVYEAVIELVEARLKKAESV